MDGETKVPFSQLLIHLNKNQISITEASEYVDNFKELKRSLEAQYLLVEKDVIHVNEMLHIANQRQQLSIINHQKPMFLKALLKDKKHTLEEKLSCEVEKTNQWNKEMQCIIEKHEAAFNEHKARYNMHPLAQQRQKIENEYKQIDIMVNIQTKTLEDAKRKFYKFAQIQEQMSRLHTVQMAKAYVLCNQTMKRKFDLAEKLRNQKQELEELKQQKENILKHGLQIKTSELSSTTCKRTSFDHLSQQVISKPSNGTKGSRGISPRITLDNIPRLQLPEWQSTPAKLQCLSSFTGTPYRFSIPLPKMLESTFSLFKSNPLSSTPKTSDTTLRDKLKQNETSTPATSADNEDMFQSSPMDTEQNCSVKPVENSANTAPDQNSIDDSEIQCLNESREERMESCNAEQPVLDRDGEKETLNDSSINIQDNLTERDIQTIESQDNLIPIRKWKAVSPEYHLKPFSISSATKNAATKSDSQTNSINIQEKEQVNNELAESNIEHQMAKEGEEKSVETGAISKDKDLQTNEDNNLPIQLISPTEHSNSSGAALTACGLLSPNSYSGTDGFCSPNMDRWTSPTISPEQPDDSTQAPEAQAINIFGGGTSVSSNQAFSLAFDFGSSTNASSAPTMLFGENEGDKQPSKDSKKKDDENHFSFGFQQFFKMF